MMGPLFKNRLFIRDLYAPTLIENFLITGVSTILCIRFYLQMTGYPSVGGAHFHIAHMLYGGLLMLVTIFILFIFLNRFAYNLASVLGGIGFGFFIDELGKFITRDNNYFFEPTIALIYVIFILIYLAGEILPKYKTISETEYLVNALELTKEVVAQDLDTNEKRDALLYLRRSDPENPLVKELRVVLTEYRVKPAGQDLYTKTTQMVYGMVKKITRNKQFYFLVIFFIVSQSIISLLSTFFIIAALNRYIFLLLGILISTVPIYLMKTRSIHLRILYFFVVSLLLVLINLITTQDVEVTLTFIGWGRVLSTALAALVAFLGLLEFGKSKEMALRYFRISVMISIFLTQFFLFYSEQFYALIGLAFNILMLLTIEFVLSDAMEKKEA